MKKRKIAIIIGSKSDLAQCYSGLEILDKCDQEVEVVGVYIRSQHRNTLDAQKLLEKLTEMEIDVAIIGAGWANHLTGCCDAFLRYTLRNDKLVVIGVAFEDKDNDKHTKAAVLSMTEVPGTKVVFDDNDLAFVGASGFARACLLAATKELPKIKLPSPKEIQDLTLKEALELSLKDSH